MAVLVQQRAALKTLLQLVWCGCVLLSAHAVGQEPGAELQIKAAFVHKFVMYVQGRPETALASTAAPVAYGVAGSEDLRRLLTQLVATQTDGRGAEVRQVTAPADLDGLQVLFVGADAANADALLDAAVAASILTVTDAPGPQPENSMIHFFVAEDRVRFDVALQPVDAAGLRLSSRLLQVARQVVASE